MLKPHFDETNREPAPRAYRALAAIARLVIPLRARTRWSGQQHIPTSGPAIVVANHISNVDPVLLGEFLIWNGRWPRFLGKASIWKVPVLGWIIAKADQIPVYRDSQRAAESLVHATEALDAGKLVAIYPEGTITADPDGWPMTGRRGAATLALASGAPVIPVVQVGADQILGGRHVSLRGLFGRRKDVSVTAGPPIDLTRYLGLEPTKQVLDEVTDLFLDTLTSMRAQVTGLTPPAGRFDLRQGRRVEQVTGPDE
ncbi:hypothetical protein BW730_03395 [Tessaracoccus aquimaris]|uniref:Phospholipid/glycerol acyltransferase domain-containing protein n=1 Tax=Tessaracoccus aquimaris TaxID=1332264 RepID=A0A1Q2CKS8_9ACTN|nr:lysophospholipid acyltransferase family protein [Tessaracoccus aquimaris]AQP46714.1 hypothetical protein BW730_03395 [Tessaracoccus aquimaris]